MTHTTRTALVPVIAATLALSACGGSASGNATPASCPTSDTRAFAEARFVADVGLAAGTFHRWIYAPYKAGAFDAGASGRLTALVKAGAVAVVDAQLVDDAYQNVQASPTLCRRLITPLGDLRSGLDTVRGQLVTGNTSALGTVDTLVNRVEAAAKSEGTSIIENSDLGAARSAVGHH